MVQLVQNAHTHMHSMTVSLLHGYGVSICLWQWLIQRESINSLAPCKALSCWARGETKSRLWYLLFVHVLHESHCKMSIEIVAET